MGGAESKDDPLQVDSPYETARELIQARYASATLDTKIYVPHDPPPSSPLPSSPSGMAYGDYASKVDPPPKIKAKAPRCREKYMREVKMKVFGHRDNHLPFLEPHALDALLPHIMDDSLLNVIAVCPHWFMCITSRLKHLCQPVAQRFAAAYGEYLDVDARSMTFSVQPLYTSSYRDVRIDMLLFAKVKNKCAGRSIQIGCSYQYVTRRSPGNRPPPGEERDYSTWVRKKELETPTALEGEVQAPQWSTVEDATQGARSDRRYVSTSRFDTLKKGSQRTLWLHRDATGFHGDELKVSTFQPVPVVCVDDWVEVPLCLSNAFGVVDISTVLWHGPFVFPISDLRSASRRFFMDPPTTLWQDIDSFQPTASERLQLYDYFGPQWVLQKTLFTGLDIICAKSEYVCHEPGVVPNADLYIGIGCRVKKVSCPLICSLKRIGMQVDRFTQHEFRKGDTVVMYTTVGGRQPA